MEARPLMLRLFLEGREVPVISATCSGGVNMGGAASIQIVPSDGVMDLLPRTLVHLFFYDGDEESGNLHDKYKVLFVGEVMGVEYVRSVSQRAAVLKCLDFSSYWDSARLLFYRTFDSDTQQKKPGQTTQKAIASGAAAYKYDRTKQSPASTLVKILTSKSIKHPNVEGFMGGLLLMLEMLGGIYDGKNTENHRGLNDFFSQAELRLHLSRTLGAARKDTSSAKLLNTRHFRKWIRNSISQQSNTISFRDIVGLVLRRLSSYYASQLCPHYTTSEVVEVVHTVTKSTKKTIGARVAARMNAVSRLKAEVDLSLQAFAKEYGDEATQLGRTFDSSSVAYSSEGLVVDENQDPMQGLARTHMQLGTEMQIFAFGSAGGYEGVDSNGDGVSVDWGSPDDLLKDKDFSAAAGTDVNAVALAADMAVQVGAGDNDPIGHRHPTITVAKLQKLSDTLEQSQKSYAKRAVTHKTEKVRVKETKLPKLYTHTFTPDLFLCPAPRCNVLLPEHISSISMSRNFAQEITRLHLTTRKEWEGKGVRPRNSKKTFIAPHVDVLFGKSAKKMMRNVEFFVFPHEVFSGVIPRFDQMPDMAAYEKLSKEKISGAPADAAKVDYLVRMADFLFVKYRIAGRVINTNGRFNPNVAAGMSMLVLPTAPPASMAQVLDKVHTEQDWRAMTTRDPHKYLDTLGANIEKNVSSYDLPIQYAGILHALQHTVNQEGGTTAYTISHVWIPSREEIPGISSMGIKFRTGSKTVKTVKRVPLAGVILKGISASHPDVTVYSSPGPAGSDAPGSTGGVQVETKDLGSWLEFGTKDTAAFLANRTAKNATSTQVQVKADGTRTKWLGPHGGHLVDASFKSWDPFTAEARTDPDTGENWSEATSGYAQLELTEKVGTYDRKEITLPFEYAVRPVWMAEVFSNLRIGPQFYQEMFGCLSICDGSFAAKYEPGGWQSGHIAVKLLASAIDQLIATAAIQIERDGEVLEPDDIPTKVKYAIQDIMGGITIMQASAEVARLYLKYQQFGNSSALSQFITQYTRRGFASMRQILGSPDLLYDQDTGVVLSGEEGFHSRAYGTWTSYVLLDHPKLLMYGGVGELRELDPKVDPRKPRYERVAAYLAELGEYGRFKT